ncbi:MAG: hypothetical protein AVDCRST_MAG86-2519, partial [uncultured Truepera sp.]
CGPREAGCAEGAATPGWCGAAGRACSCAAPGPSCRSIRGSRCCAAPFLVLQPF